MTSNEQCEAVDKLLRWLDDNNKSQAWLASKCGVTPPSVHAWLSRTSRPVTYLREVIEAVTDGHVPASDWDLPSEVAKRELAIRQARAEAQDKVTGDAA